MTESAHLLTIENAATVFGVTLDDIHRYRNAWDQNYCDCPKCCTLSFPLEPKTKDGWASVLWDMKVFNIYVAKNTQGRNDYDMRLRSALAWEAVGDTAAEIYPRDKQSRVKENYEAVVRKLKRLQKKSGKIAPWKDVHAIVKMAPWSRELDEAFKELDQVQQQPHQVENSNSKFDSGPATTTTESLIPRRVIAEIVAKEFGVTFDQMRVDDPDDCENAFPTEISDWVALHELALQKRKLRRPAIAHLVAAVFDRLRDDYLWLTGLDKPNWTNDTHLHGDFIDYQKSVWNAVCGRLPSEAALRGRYSAK